MIMMTIKETPTWLQETDDCSICELFNSVLLDSFIIYSPGGVWKGDGGRGWLFQYLKSLFVKSGVCSWLWRESIISLPITTDLLMHIFWIKYSSVASKKGSLFSFVSYQGYYKKVFFIVHWLVWALMVRVLRLLALSLSF